GLIPKGSAGAGNWADVPWLAVFDPLVTTTATRGYYVVYLFHNSEPEVHLSLNQGNTVRRKAYGTKPPPTPEALTVHVCLLSAFSLTARSECIYRLRMLSSAARLWEAMLRFGKGRWDGFV